MVPLVVRSGLLVSQVILHRQLSLAWEPERWESAKHVIKLLTGLLNGCENRVSSLWDVLDSDMKKLSQHCLCLVTRGCERE